MTSGHPDTARNGNATGDTEQIPILPWCRDCWDQAGEGSQTDCEGLPDECQHCGSSEVFWI